MLKRASFAAFYKLFFYSFAPFIVLRLKSNKIHQKTKGCDRGPSLGVLERLRDFGEMYNVGWKE